jgi:hypothetical protein
MGVPSPLPKSLPLDGAGDGDGVAPKSATPGDGPVLQPKPPPAGDGVGAGVTPENPPSSAKADAAAPKMLL